MSTWSEEKRRNLAADAEQRRIDAEHKQNLRREQRREDAQFERDQRQRDKEEQRREKARARKERQQRHADRARAWTPERLYGRSTYTVVIASELASLPAQFLHFGHIDPMLLTIPVALSGAAWATFAGVAYADQKGVHPAIRWGLRVLSMGFASFAAWINWLYGKSLAQATLSPDEASVAAAALAAVTMLGPLLFEVRQWVRTLSATTRDPKKRAEEKARAKHAKKRQRTFRRVARRQRQIMLAEPYGTVTAEDAWGQAWADVEGAKPGVTASVVEHRIAAEKAVTEAIGTAGLTPEQTAVDILLAELFPTSRGDDGPAGGSRKKAPQGGPRGDGGRGVRTAEKKATEGATALGGIGERASGRASRRDAEEPLSEDDIATARKLHGANPKTFSTPLIARTIGRSKVYAQRVRDHVLATADSANR